MQLHVTHVEYLDQTGKREERTKIRTFLGALKYTADEMDHPIARVIRVDRKQKFSSENEHVWGRMY